MPMTRVLGRRAVSDVVFDAPNGIVAGGIDLQARSELLSITLNTAAMAQLC